MTVSVSVIRRRIEEGYTTLQAPFNPSPGVSSHREMGTLYGDIDILNKTVVIEFETPFTIRPIGWFRLYRMRQRGSDWVQSMVVFRHATENWLGLESFEFKIDESESLTGIILEYYYTE